MSKNGNIAHYQFCTKKKSKLYYGYVMPFLALYLILSSVYAQILVNGPKQIYTLYYKKLSLIIYNTTIFNSAVFLVAFMHTMLLLLNYWSLEAHIFFSYKKTKNPMHASHVYIKAKRNCGSSEICPIRRDNYDSFSSDSPDIRYFVFQKIKYLFNTKMSDFEMIKYPTDRVVQSYFETQGLSGSEVEISERKYGKNIFEIPKITFHKLFIEHVTAPFFVFQLFSILLWSLDGYLKYSLYTIAMLFFFEAAMAYRRLKNLKDISDMRFPSFPVQCYRNKKWEEINSFDLYPGDIISVKNHKDYPSPCDALVLAGNCVVNEALLTGESTPKIKDALGNSDGFDKNLDLKSAHKRHLVSSGTFILRSDCLEEEEGIRNKPKIENPPDNGAISFVLQTSYATNQGKLLRTILFSNEKSRVGEDAEAIKFIIILMLLSVCASGYVLYKALENGTDNIWDILLNCAMIISMVVPAELPMILSLAINSAIAELAKLKVFCSESFRVPHAGALDYCFFDKTGTLTSDAFDFEGVVKSFKVPKNKKMPETISPSKLLRNARVIIGGCHSISHAEKLSGDSLEIAAFEGAGFCMSTRGSITSKNMPKVQSSGKEISSIKILKRFPFSSVEKKMSCVVRLQSGKETFYVAKGAPERMKPILKNVPANYDKYLEFYSEKGYRVICIAIKRVGYNSKITLKQLDSALEFEGFMLFRCPLKKGSLDTVMKLRESSHKVVMITGDNVLTGNYFAACSGICLQETAVLTLEENGEKKLVWKLKEGKFCAFSTELSQMSENYDLSITGAVLEFVAENFPAVAKELMKKIKVFARMSPMQKEKVVRVLKEDGNSVLMCGDGTNDVGALRQAQVGVALANEEETEEGKDSEAPKKGKIKTKKEKKIADAPNKPKKKLTFKEILEEFKKKADEEDPDKIQINMNVASIASPFTSRTKTIEPILNLVRQGRKTLVVNAQMYVILALNCLISTYFFSYFYLSKTQLSDAQEVTSEMLATSLFMFVSTVKPLETLCAEKPRRKVISLFVFFTILAQLSVHFAVLYAASIVLPAPVAFIGPVSPEFPSRFSPSIANTFLFYLSNVTNIATFVPNYTGRPFMPCLRNNKPFFRAICVYALFMALCIFNLLPEVTGYLELLDITKLEIFPVLLSLLFLDFFGAVLAQKVVMKLFGGSDASECFNDREKKTIAERFDVIEMEK